MGVLARSLLAACTVVALLPAAGSPSNAVGDTQLRAILIRQVPIVEQTGRTADAGRGGPDAVQAQYDAARDLEDALTALPPVSAGCLQRRNLARALARGEVLQAEGYDRPSVQIAAEGARLAAAATAALASQDLGSSCTQGPPVIATETAQLNSPESYEPFSGRLQTRAPARASEVELRVDGHRLAIVNSQAGQLSLPVLVKPGRHTLELRFRDRTGRLIAIQRSESVWLLPRSWTTSPAASRDDRALDASLAALANSFPGHAAIWIQNLRSGRQAAWNADARFPAASLVKLALLVAGLGRLGPHPEQASGFYDLQQLTGWSSNLAANRLLRTLAGSEQAGTQLAQNTLDRLGASSSTYTGDYRVGTALHHTTDAPDPPPLISGRVTTARDLARILTLLDSAAAGDQNAQRITRLDLHQARLALGLLLDSQPIGDNLGLFRPWLPLPFPIAQKNGWLSAARHTAALLYPADGPRIAILLTYQPDETRRQAARLGRQVLQTALAAH
ncbi:MAG TPA: serine hydrolase [Gaiellaceae bacterium]|nr:serine hydrolase [Gaiellaceae bacterium]